MKRTKQLIAQLTPWNPAQSYVYAMAVSVSKSKLSSAGRAYPNHAMNAGPSRRFQSADGGAITRFNSTKTNTQVLLERQRGELALAVTAQADPNGIAFFAHTSPIEVKFKDAKGRVRFRTRYTPDRLTVTRNEAIALQAGDLPHLTAWQVKGLHCVSSGYGDQYFRVASEALGKLGIKHKVVDVSNLSAAPRQADCTHQALPSRARSIELALTLDEPAANSCPQAPARQSL